MKKAILTLIFLAVTAPLFAKELVIFTGIPEIKISEGGISRVVDENPTKDKAIEFKCIITKIDDKYYWTSRENVELIPIASGAFITYWAVNATGYVRIINPEMKKIVAKAAIVAMARDPEEKFDYVEHLLLGLKSVTYYGKSNSLALANKSQDIDLLWKARALKSVENIEVMTGKLQKEDSKKLRFEIILEYAYAALLLNPEIISKKTSTVNTYHLLLNYGDDGGLDVLYNYDPIKQKLLSVSIDRLPKDRRISMICDMPNIFWVLNYEEPNEPVFVFNRADPFDIMILSK